MRVLLLSLVLCSFACESSDDPEVVQVGDPSSVPASDSGGGTANAPRASGDGGRAVSGSRGRGGSDRNAAATDSGLDSSSVLAPTTPSADDAGAVSSYACERNLDCVIKDVGSCCGYYPRCANVASLFPPANCATGQVGVCGFPIIDSCECRQNRCISLQAGKPL